MPRRAITKSMIPAVQTTTAPTAAPAKKEESRSVLADSLLSGVGSGVGFSLGNALFKSFLTATPAPIHDPTVLANECDEVKKQFVKCCEKYDRATCKDILGYNKCPVD